MSVTSTARATSSRSPKHGQGPRTPSKKNVPRDIPPSSPLGQGSSERGGSEDAICARGGEEKEESEVKPIPLPSHIISEDYCTFWVRGVDAKAMVGHGRFPTQKSRSWTRPCRDTRRQTRLRGVVPTADESPSTQAMSPVTLTSASVIADGEGTT